MTQMSLSWEDDLRAYAAPTGDAADAARAALADAVRAAPESADAWWALFLHEERAAGASPRSPPPRGGVALIELYRWATRLAPRPRADADATPGGSGGAFARVWVGYARRQWGHGASGPDDARDTFKALRSQAIGGAWAPLYREWAALEAGPGGGGAAKADAVLAKGLRDGAAPAALLEGARAELKARFALAPAPFWELEARPELWAPAGGAAPRAPAPPGPAASATGGTYGAFSTPAAPAAERRPGGALTAAATPSAGPSARAAAAAPPAGARTASAVHTTLHSGSTAGSSGADDGTATVRMRTPAAGGARPPPPPLTVASGRSGSSDGSDEATVALGRGGGGGASGRPPRTGGAEETLLINRSGAATPRSFGMAGRAVRVTTPGTAGAAGTAPRVAPPPGFFGDCTGKELPPPAAPPPAPAPAPPAAAPRAAAGEGKLAPIVEASSKALLAAARAAAPPRAPPGAMGPPPPSAPRPMAPPPPRAAPAAAPGPTAAAMRRAAAPAALPRIEDESTVVVRGVAYAKLECVGRGGSSRVYKVMAPNRKIFALKRIRFSGRDAEAAAGFIDEIALLETLRGRANIIQLVDAEVHHREGLIFVVLEYGDIDLARLLQRRDRQRAEQAAGRAAAGAAAPATPSGAAGAAGAPLEVDENFIRLYWEQMLGAVAAVHAQRIVHSDLKPANFLVVEGCLKLIDFGIAKVAERDTTSIARESQVGTLNYMSPEAILGAAGGSGPAAARLTGGGAPLKVGRASDIWSLGCILYQMVHGRTPFAHLPFIQKMQAIIDPEHAVEYPPLANAALEDVLRRCLERNPRTRATMAELEAHAFLRPTAAAPPTPGGAPGAAGSVELSQEQLRRLLVKVSAAAAAGASGADVGQLSEALFRQLSNGGGLSPEPAPAVARKAAPMPPPMPGAAAKAAAPPPPPGASGMAAAAAAARAAAPRIEPQEQREPAEPSSLATAAAAAATAMADCRAAAAAAPEAAQPAAGRGPLMDISAEAIRAKAAGLRKVGGPSMAPGFQPGATAAPPPPPPPPPPAEGGGVEAALSAGLERFRFDDTRTVAFGEAGGA